MKALLSSLAEHCWRNPARFVKAHATFLIRLPNVALALFARPGGETAGDIKISLLCPTRSRPREMMRMWHSAVATAKNPESIEVIFYLDNDDSVGMAGLRLAATKRAAQVSAVVGERIILSKCWNAAAEIAKGEILMHCGDDIIFRSRGWDAVAAEKIMSFPDRIAFVYGRDGIMDEELGTHGFISREWAKATGYVVPPIFSSDYNDTWLNEVAEKIGRKFYLPDIYTEHMHFVAKKSVRDNTYRDRLKRHERDNVVKLWEDTAHLREQDAQKLLAHIASFDKEEK